MFFVASALLNARIGLNEGCQPVVENPNPTAPANERLYYCQNRRADVVALVTSSGRQVEQARYSAYGVPFGLPMGDTDGDGDVDAADLTQIQSWIDHSIYDVRGDLDLDGDVDAADKALASALSGTTLGRGVLTRSTIGNRSGYGGYLYHGTVLKYHVRNRVYDPYTGRWLTRDPIGYLPSNLSLYAYATEYLLATTDPLGLFLLTADLPKGPKRNYELDPSDKNSPGIDKKNIHEIAQDLKQHCEDEGYSSCSRTTISCHGMPGYIDIGEGEILTPTRLRDIKRLRDDPSRFPDWRRKQLEDLDNSLQDIFDYSDEVEFFCCEAGSGDEGAELADLLHELYEKPVTLPKRTVRYLPGGIRWYDIPWWPFGKSKEKRG